jgi:phenylalanyl-tRNA synthetase beta chain
VIISEQWLREWVSPEISTEDLAHQITMAGLEVDAIDPVAGEFTGVLVAEIRAPRRCK